MNTKQAKPEQAKKGTPIAAVEINVTHNDVIKPHCFALKGKGKKGMKVVKLNLEVVMPFGAETIETTLKSSGLPFPTKSGEVVSVKFSPLAGEIISAVKSKSAK